MPTFCKTCLARSVSIDSTFRSLLYIFVSAHTHTHSSSNGKDENLIGNSYTCKRLETLLVGYAKGKFHHYQRNNLTLWTPTAAAEAFNATLEPLDKKLSKYIGGNPIRVDGKPRASGVMDTVRSLCRHQRGL